MHIHVYAFTLTHIIHIYVCIYIDVLTHMEIIKEITRRPGLAASQLDSRMADWSDSPAVGQSLLDGRSDVWEAFWR